ncbi:TIGR01459 family HAD-type hydrolase [Phyllobacterium salinisoli]|uniref:TIGR01459 family HAD-type hydrolase n=1 Tax=Phyllobacterium salinisoli TaxID=1899321 RepID=A0A368JY17_9HYPH|nr:TIGR01459 family HAD-type hydrolase [Phyllobacterium salinisoli]RCS21794.1 TIGR01459 family HAD-type hydrolase [Phyllobacterium salinisoli]
MIDIPTTTLLDLIARYDVFFIDQFGVLRDDEGAYRGAIEALRRLKAMGKAVVILSNSGRSGDYNAKRLSRIGFVRDSFDHFVTSGDAAYAVLSRQGPPVPPGSNCLTISSGDDRNLAERLGMRTVEDAAKADLVVISGGEAETVPMEFYAEMLRPAAERRIPAICTNPDIHKLAGGTIAAGAGSIAQLYERLGGPVRWFGKPFGDIYEQALQLSGNPARVNVVCIGDSIDHDVLGASRSGLDSVLVRTGILAQFSAEELGGMLTKDRRPTFMMAAFR